MFWFDRVSSSSMRSVARARSETAGRRRGNSVSERGRECHVTLVASELDKESDRGRETSIVDRRGPINDFDEHVWIRGRHGSSQLCFGDHEIWESEGHAVDVGDRSTK